MKNTFMAIVAFGLTAGSAAAAQTYTLDPAHSYAVFKIGHMGLSTLYGRIDTTKGTIVMDREGGASRVEVTLDPASVDTGHAERDRHLREKDGFFEVDQYPTIRFVSDDIRFDGDDNDEATVDGKLTLHGVTRPVTLEVEDINCKPNPLEKTQYTCGFSAETTIKRSNFGMGAFIPLVADEVEIMLEVEASRPMDQ